MDGSPFFFLQQFNTLLLAQGTEKKIPLLHKSIQVLWIMPLLPPCPDNSSGCLGTFILHKYHTSWRSRNKCSLTEFCFSILWKEQKESVSSRFSSIKTRLNGRPELRHIHWKTCTNSFLIFLFIILQYFTLQIYKKFLYLTDL